MFYEIDDACPIPWPETAPYLVDQDVEMTVVASTSSDTPTSAHEDLEAGTIDTLRIAYLDALYGHSTLKGKSESERVACFALWLKRPATLDVLQRGLEPLADCDRKWRTLVPQSLTSSAESELQGGEDTALRIAHSAYQAQNNAVQHDKKGKSKWKHLTRKEWLSSMETIEHELQILILLTILSLPSPSTDSAQLPTAEEPDHEAHLDLLTDRLAMYQALHGISDLGGSETLQTGDVELDEVQSFWQFIVEPNFHHAISREAMLEHRSKLFPRILTPDPSVLSDDDEYSSYIAAPLQTSRSIPASPFSHPTPNLMKLARSVQEAQQQQQNAANQVPPSPTLQKLLGINNKRAGFKRSRSSGAVALANRQVSMTRTASVEVLENAAIKQSLFGGKTKARTSKRKQASPKKSTMSKTLVMATPTKKLARTLSLPNLDPSLHAQPTQSKNASLSFAALGKAFRPGFQTFGGFAPISEEGYAIRSMLVGETPQKSQTRMELDALGTTPG